jgi:restriction endonuclease
VRADIEEALYGELEPLPVATSDLADLVRARPEGAVTTALNWAALDDDDFERLLFNVLTGAEGYEDARWLMKTRAPDRGRDLSVTRVITDSLSEVTRQRVIVQCRHWLSRSMNAGDCILAAGHVSLWEPPRVDVLIIANSGRFTADAVQWAEHHDAEAKSPRVELWADSHLEFLLASRPTLVTEMGLRAG